jgi:hypothetical protein
MYVLVLLTDSLLLTSETAERSVTELFVVVVRSMVLVLLLLLPSNAFFNTLAFANPRAIFAAPPVRTSAISTFGLR